jgi:hypothetical protein
MGHSLKIKCVDSRVNVHILAKAPVKGLLVNESRDKINKERKVERREIIESQQEQFKVEIKLNKSLKRGKEATSLAVLLRCVLPYCKSSYTVIRFV